MEVFRESADLYDAIYHDKDFAAEAEFVTQLISRYSSEARTILDLGCGTGRHASQFAERGFQVVGVDLSAEMIKKARANAEVLRSGVHRPVFVQGDASGFSTTDVFDVVVSLFHVVNYHVTNETLLAAFRSARNALKAEGLFIFDFWYGAAVLTDRPTTRTKRIETPDGAIIRIAEPELCPDRNVVDVNYTFRIERRGANAPAEIHETHSIRYLFLPEIELIASMTGFEVQACGKWLTSDPLREDSWFGYIVAKAIR